MAVNCRSNAALGSATILVITSHQQVDHNPPEQLITSAVIRSQSMVACVEVDCYAGSVRWRCIDALPVDVITSNFAVCLDPLFTAFARPPFEAHLHEHLSA
jgi:hypothetical protein